MILNSVFRLQTRRTHSAIWAMSSNQNQNKLSTLLLSFIPAVVFFDPVSEHTNLQSEKFNEKHATARDPAARGGGEEKNISNGL